jgi:DICT domain-containing protein/predicted DNA-binding transcriptional regulator AlpA
MTASPGNHLLSIGALAERTGVPSATLRSWEARYGFPRPIRERGGHRRYPESEVAAVLRVLHHREAGYALEAAVRLAATESRRPQSVYAELRRRHPELAPRALSKDTLVALSRAIEDECCARAEEPFLFGAFQKQRFLRQAYGRWVELARTARAAVVFADLPTAAAPTTGAGAPGTLVEVALPREAALNREWLIVCDAPDLPACLAAVERPGQGDGADARRRFDAVWTVDPAVVRHAARVAAGIADELRPGWRPDGVTGLSGLAGLEDEPPGASADLRRATDLLSRMVEYVDARH